MEYTKTFNKLKSVFSIDKKIIPIPDSDIVIYNLDFESDLPLSEFINKNDQLIPENRSFSYPDLKNLKGSSVNRLLRATFAKLDIPISPLFAFLSCRKLIIALGSFHEAGDLLI